MTEVVFSRRDLRMIPGSDGRIYTVAPLTYREKQRLNADLAAAGAVYPSRVKMFAGIRTAIREIAPENEAELLAMVDEYEAAVGDLKPGEVLPEDLQARYDLIEGVARKVPVYAALIAEQQFYIGLLPFHTLQLALRAWEGPGLPPFRRARDRVPAELVEAMGDADINAVGWEAQKLGQPDQSAGKNSAPPSP